MRRTILAGLLLATCLATSATSAPSPLQDEIQVFAPRVATKIEAQALAQASAFDRRGMAACNSIFKNTVRLYGEPEFPALPPSVRAGALAAVLECERNSEALLFIATELEPIATTPRQIGLANFSFMQQARREKQPYEAANRLEKVLASAPELISSAKPLPLWRVYHGLDKDPVRQQQLLAAIIAAPWTDPTYQRMADNYSSIMYARALLKDGKTAQARASLAKVSEPASLAEIAEDRTFAAFWDEFEAAGLFDWPVIAKKAFEKAQAQSDNTSLANVQRRMGYLRAMGRNEEALALGQTALDKIKVGAKFSDQDRVAWLHTDMAYALQGVDRNDEALKQQRLAIKNQQSDLVSHKLNLGVMLADMARNKEALQAIKGTREKSSAFGRMVFDSVVVCAQTASDPVAAQAVLDTMQLRWRDGPGSLIRALICMDQGDGAVEVYIKRLKDPELRPAALKALRLYAPESASGNQPLRLRAKAVENDPRVIEVLNSVGRRLTLPAGFSGLNY